LAVDEYLMVNLRMGLKIKNKTIYRLLCLCLQGGGPTLRSKGRTKEVSIWKKGGFQG
jgi:hypothetical protein